MFRDKRCSPKEKAPRPKALRLQEEFINTPGKRLGPEIALPFHVHSKETEPGKQEKPMVQWKKTGHSCPHCDQGTEVLVGTMGDHDSVRSAETCWRCGWVAGSDKEEGKPEDMVRMLNEKETAKN